LIAINLYIFSVVLLPQRNFDLGPIIVGIPARWAPSKPSRPYRVDGVEQTALPQKRPPPSSHR
jgi:hypothetical protein